MRRSKKILFLLIIILLVGGIIISYQNTKIATPDISKETSSEQQEEPESGTATSSQVIIGTSVEGRNIEVYTFGTGTTSLLFVGGIHGGYEWNSILLAYKMIEYFQSNYSSVPNNVTVHIIPNLNPDGLYLATGLEGRFSLSDIKNNNMHNTGTGRFNANHVDLNRNFDCKWQPTSSWKGQKVSAGKNAFSEPEAEALRKYVTEIKASAVVMWHSQANNVYGSECEKGILPDTITLMNTYAKAGNYGAVPKFDAYPVTGDAEGWLASINIPAVTIELETRTSIEWDRNLAGVTAIIDLYKE